MSSTGSAFDKITAHDIRAKVRGLIAETLGVDIETIVDDADIFHDLNGDDLDRLDIVMAIESDFGLNLNDDEIEGCATAGDFVRLIERVTGVADVASA